MSRKKRAKKRSAAVDQAIIYLLAGLSMLLFATVAYTQYEFDNKIENLRDDFIRSEGGFRYY